jgi:hypothetical protein
MGSFKSQFWTLVKNDRRARAAIEKVPASSHNRCVRLLELLTDPEAEKRIRKSAPGTREAFFFPSPIKLSGMAGRLKIVSEDLEQLEQIPIPFSEQLLKFARECQVQSQILTLQAKLATTAGHRFTHKSFWKRIPAAMLCRELIELGHLSHREVENLVRCADRARARTRVRPNREIERQYKGFRQSKGKFADSTYMGAWPLLLEKFLDLMLKTVPTR